MNNIKVKVLFEGHENPMGVETFLARLTQRGHNIDSMEKLDKLYADAMINNGLSKRLTDMPHSTIKRFSPVTIAIVGASRRFLAQARTHQVGITYVSASLQYSDYSGKGQFVIPYEILEKGGAVQESYEAKCKADLDYYGDMIKSGVSNDTAGYAMNQALRNVLIIQANQESWAHFIRMRSCNRNTAETQYVTIKIWEALLKTSGGDILYSRVGPDCLYGQCREGAMSCGIPMDSSMGPSDIIKERWPLLIKGAHDE